MLKGRGSGERNRGRATLLRPCCDPAAPEGRYCQIGPFTFFTALVAAAAPYSMWRQAR